MGWESVVQLTKRKTTKLRNGYSRCKYFLKGRWSGSGLFYGSAKSLTETSVVLTEAFQFLHEYSKRFFQYNPEASQGVFLSHTFQLTVDCRPAFILSPTSSLNVFWNRYGLMKWTIREGNGCLQEHSASQTRGTQSTSIRRYLICNDIVHVIYLHFI
jgi:hypothetical protein